MDFIDNPGKKSEASYREMLMLLSERIDDVFFIFNLQNEELEFTSDNSLRVLGIAPKEFQRNRTVLYKYLDQDVAKSIESSMLKDSPTEMIAYEAFYHNPAKPNTCWLRIKFYPVLDANKKLSKYIIIISDTTKECEIKQVLHDSLTIAQNANTAKTDFLSRMSHEIRTPLNAIIGMSTIAGVSIDDKDRVRDCLEKIKLSSHHLLTLINDVLDMSKIERGKMNISTEEFDFKKFINSVTSIIYPQAEAADINFEVVFFGLTDEILIGDSLRLNQVLINLLSNAVKFTPKNGNVRLEVRQLERNEKNSYLRFVVIDNGIGMGEEFVNNLFQPFVQEDNSIAQHYGGTGLGLAISKNIVTMMGGTIGVSSVKDEGSMFTVEIHLGVVKGSTANVFKNISFDNMRVLVVDDDKDTCEHAKLIFKSIGVSADCVLSGKDAIQKVVEAKKSGDSYDICFIDWQMPEVNGIQTTKLIREEIGSETLVIIMSSYDWASIEKEARVAGVNAFMSKPMFQSSVYNQLLSLTGNSIVIPEAVEIEKYDFKGKRILLVEDNVINMEIASTLLKYTGADIYQAKNGKIALDMFSASAIKYYDTILMDIQMPVMDGYDSTMAIRALKRSDAKSICIIAMTANAFSEDVDRALKSGMDAHIAKPISSKLLYSTLHGYLFPNK